MTVTSVDIATLRETTLSGEPDPGTEALLAAELGYIQKRRGGATRDDLAGLALSGGGIRSSTFALGVLQALAAGGILKRMDYLSTVSGGGYVGSALTWLLGRHNQGRGFGLDSETFPFGIDAGWNSTDLQRRMLNWLRQHGNYLTPGAGITLTAGIAVLLRGLLLNAIVWLPIGIGLFMALRWLAAWATPLFSGWGGWIDWLATLLWGSPLAADPLVLVALSFAAAISGVFVITSLVYSWITWLPKPAENSRYRLRRFVETFSRLPLWLAGSAVVLASIPLVADFRGGGILALDGPLAALAGAAIGIWGFLRTLRGKAGRLVSWMCGVGTVLLVYGYALTCFRFALMLMQTASPGVWTVYQGLLVLSVFTGVFVNINYISIHRFYRDRLLETFLPDVDRALAGETGPAFQADIAPLQTILPEDAPESPYHIVNTTVVLVNSTERRRRLRGGDSFILTPFFCGSNATGWIPTDKILDGGLSLATAAAISGAAAFPTAGTEGVNLTRSRSISLLLTLLNLRLGYWLPNPRRECGRMPPNHFVPGLSRALGRLNEQACFIELRDGGNFENLALYELVRRRLKLIIVCDAAADPKFGFADLNTVRRRIGADFGARIHFEPGHDPENLIPLRLRRTAPNDAGYAVDADMAEASHLLGHIDYADGTSGALIYIKTTMVEDVSFGVKAYKGAHRDFPDQTTADQFFDEEQFDAYRELGRHLGRRMLEQTDLPARLDAVIAKGGWT